MAEGGGSKRCGGRDKHNDVLRSTDSATKMKIQDKTKTKGSNDSKLAKLKKDVIRVLKKHPAGVMKQDIWNLVIRETGRRVSATEYGVSEMSLVFEKWSDCIDESGERLVLRHNVGADTAPVLNEGDFPPLKGSNDSKFAILKKDVIRVLKKHPAGVMKQDIWNLVIRETGRRVSATEYGVSKMSLVFEKWSDCIDESGERLVLRHKVGADTAPVLNESDFPPLNRKQGPSAKEAATQESCGVRPAHAPVKAEKSGNLENSTHMALPERRPILSQPTTNRHDVNSYRRQEENTVPLTQSSSRENVNSLSSPTFLSLFGMPVLELDSSLPKEAAKQESCGVRPAHVRVKAETSGNLETSTHMVLPERRPILSQPTTNRHDVNSYRRQKENTVPLTQSSSRENVNCLSSPTFLTQFGMPVQELDSSQHGMLRNWLNHMDQEKTSENRTMLEHSNLRQHLVMNAFDGYKNNRSWQPFMDDIKKVAFKQIEKEEFEVKVIDVRQVYVPPGGSPSKEQIDHVAKECIEMLTDANLFVTQERVEKMVCRRFACRRIQDLGISHADQITCVFDMNRLISKINAYITAFLKTRSICTLYELREALTDYAPDKDDFSLLKTGPLQRFPIVFQQFRFPPDQAEIPEITSMHILDHFNNFLSQNGLWVNGVLKLESFMDYLVEEYNADNAYQLGIRIRSLPLAIGVLKKAKRDAANSHREIKEHFEETLKTDIGEAFRKFQTSILQTGDDIGMEIRKHYLNMKPEVAIMDVFDKFHILLIVLEVKHERVANNMKRVIKDFVTLLKEDDLCKKILHLAICMSSTVLGESALELLAPTCDHDYDAEEGQTQHQHVQRKPPPRKDALVGSLKTYIERCLNAGSLSLTHLDRIEEKLLEDYEFTAFSLMGYGRFLKFLLSEMKQILEEGGGLMLGSSSGSAESDSSFKPHQTDILEFIKQCRQCTQSQPEQIEAALCKQFSVKEVRHLGYGNITRLLSYADKHDRHIYGEFTVFYESTLIQYGGLSSGHSMKVGIMGHQTRDAAKICLHNCPMLENMADWCQWALVFEPEHGKLKDFVQKYGGVTTIPVEGGRLATLDFLALELKPGELVKIVSSTSHECVAKALEARDVHTTAGHLVSMAVAYKGVENMPNALLSAHVKTALLQMHAREERYETIDALASPSVQHTTVWFVLQCLIHIPTKICVSLANQIFLEPLGQVVGSSKSKELLVQLCKNVSELNRLVEVGCLLGIQEWTDVIQQKCQLHHSSIQIPEVEEELFETDDLEEEEDEDEEMFDESDMPDVDEILAGDLGKDNVNDRSEIDRNCSNKTEDTEEQNAPLVEDIDSDVVVTKEACEDRPLEDRPLEDRPLEDIIEEIRRDEFGVGIQLSEDGQRLMKVQQERLGRSLDRLSKGLYSKDTHFVLELIQNADDNSYHDDLLSNTLDDCPAVKFVIDKDGIYVFNNELGFKETNIRALCDVGRSTKGKHKFGYIGQKGIGFKSVFRVTDCPEVHSNGYHIKFDVGSGPMGYILPHWVPEQERISQDGWTTHIILRLKPDIRLQTHTLAARFNDIHPSLLLFLHRLRQITLENKIDNSEQTMRRRDVGENIVEIQHSHGCDRWLVVKKMLDASKISLQAKSGADVESTEIALAFPLKQQGQKITVQTIPRKQPVFAFLPLRSYGFRFIIQGDFDVPSSREDVDKDSSWNQWLRNEIHTVFIDALEIFKSQHEFSSVETACTFLQFVPMEDEVLDFFKPVASDILKKLRAKPCVPTQPNSEGVVSWKMPSQTVRVRDPLVRSVITAELLQTHLNMSYLHSDVASMLNLTLTSCLGIETLTSDHLYQLGKALIVNIGTHCREPHEVVLIAKWMACMYRSLDEFHHDDAILTTLRSQRLLPLSDGELIALQDKTVFYPIPNSGVKCQKGKDPLYYLQEDVKSLHPMLLNTDDDEVNSQVHKLLLRLGIKQLSPFDVINSHIIPVLKSNTWQSKSEGTLISYMVYIKEQTEKNSAVCNLEDIKDIAMVMTNHGFKNPSKEPVHFTPQYGKNQINLQELFVGYDWTLIDPSYLPYRCTQSVVVSWHEFFCKLGVENFLSIRRKTVHIKREELASSQWSTESLLWPKAESEFIIQDYRSVELEALLINNKYPSGEAYLNQMRHLCVQLDRTWESRFSKYCVTHVLDKDEQRLKETATSLSILLKTTKWLPAYETQTNHGRDGSVKREARLVVKEPSLIYMKSAVVENLLADKVLYLNETLGTSFSQFLGIKTVVTIETVKEHLLKWSERKKDDSPTVFCTSLEHMKNVYSYLGKELRRQDFRELLQEKPVFFVPERSITGEGVVPGKMLNKNEIWLSDNTELLMKHRQLLEDYRSHISHKRTIGEFYADRLDIIELFRQEGMLDAQPRVEEYIVLLCLLCSTNTPNDSEVLSDVLYIFSTIGQALVASPEGMPEWLTANKAIEALKSFVKKKLQRQKVFPTNKQTWVSIEDNPVISDNREWEKMFADKPGVHFLDMEDKAAKCVRKERGGVSMRGQRSKVIKSRVQPDMIDVVIDVCGIKKLSECVDITPTPEMIKPCPQLQAYFHRIVPTIQQYLMVRFDDVYQRLEQIRTKEMLTDAKFYQTGKLEVSYWLNNMAQDTFVIRPEKCVIHPPTFFFHHDHLGSIVEINREIARYFSVGNSACNTSLRSFLSELCNITSGVTEYTVDALLQTHEADGADISADEKWEVLAPVLPKPDVPREPEVPRESEEVLVSEGQVSEPTGHANGPFEMKAWPPVDGANRKQPAGNSEHPTSNVWPPPQAKDYMMSVKDLPSNIRMVATGTVEQGDKSGGSENGDKKVGAELDAISKQDGIKVDPCGERPRTYAETGADAGHSNHVCGERAMHGGEHHTGIALNSETSSTSDQDRHEKRKLSESDENAKVKRHSGVEEHRISIEDEHTPHSHSAGSASHSPGCTQAQKHVRRPIVIEDNPVWSYMATEYAYDNLGSGVDLAVVKTLTLQEGAGDPEVGRWGEALVAEYLRGQKELGNISDYKWANTEEEKGCPFDFEVQLAGENDICKNYIEVKSTLSNDKEVFDISVQQIKFANEKKNSYHIYRVFNAGNSDRVRLIRITNLDMRLSSKQVKLCMLI